MKYLPLSLQVFAAKLCVCPILGSASRIALLRNTLNSDWAQLTSVGKVLGSATGAHASVTRVLKSPIVLATKYCVTLYPTRYWPTVSLKLMPACTVVVGLVVCDGFATVDGAAVGCGEGLTAAPAEGIADGAGVGAVRCGEGRGEGAADGSGLDPAREGVTDGAAVG